MCYTIYSKSITKQDMFIMQFIYVSAHNTFFKKVKFSCHLTGADKMLLTVPNRLLTRNRPLMRMLGGLEKSFLAV